MWLPVRRIAVPILLLPVLLLILPGPLLLEQRVKRAWLHSGHTGHTQRSLDGLKEDPITQSPLRHRGPPSRPAELAHARQDMGHVTGQGQLLQWRQVRVGIVRLAGRPHVPTPDRCGRRCAATLGWPRGGWAGGGGVGLKRFELLLRHDRDGDGLQVERRDTLGGLSLQDQGLAGVGSARLADNALFGVGDYILVRVRYVRMWRRGEWIDPGCANLYLA